MNNHLSFLRKFLPGTFANFIVCKTVLVILLLGNWKLHVWEFVALHCCLFSHPVYNPEYPGQVLCSLLSVCKNLVNARRLLLLACHPGNSKEFLIRGSPTWLEDHVSTVEKRCRIAGVFCLFKFYLFLPHERETDRHIPQQVLMLWSTVLAPGMLREVPG